jgi:hypothetical protein
VLGQGYYNASSNLEQPQGCSPSVADNSTGSAVVDSRSDASGVAGEWSEPAIKGQPSPASLQTRH